MPYAFGGYQALKIGARDKNELLLPRGNAGIHPFFGIVITNDVGGVLGTEDALDQQFDDYVPRELGISKEIVKNNRILKGLANPGSYLLVKNQDLERIGVELTAIYKNEYIKQVNYGKSIEDSKKQAMKYTKLIEELKINEHDEMFPVELTKETMNKLRRKNEQGNYL